MYRILALVLALGFCMPANAEEMRVDGSSVESYERSVKAMADTLSPEDKRVFGRGLMSLIVTKYPPAQGAEGLLFLQAVTAAMEAAHITMDGVTRSEILARGRELEARDAAKKSTKPATGNSEKTDGNLDNPDESLRACLTEKVLLTGAKVKRRDFGYAIEMNVTNNLPWAIAGIRVQYRVSSPGRSVPWAKDDFSLPIRGGVEPGETRQIKTSTLSIPPDAPAGLLTEAVVLDVTDSDEQQLIRDVRVMGWGDKKSARKCE